MLVSPATASGELVLLVTSSESLQLEVVECESTDTDKS